MENDSKVEITLDTLYKSLKKHDAEILKNFNNEEISDDNYFFLAINSDIMSNGLGIVTNLLCNNFGSIGIDQNCRSLLEAFVILKMRAENAISEDQIKLFRYQYALVERDNFSTIITEDEKRNSNEWQRLERDCKTARELLCKIYGIDEPKLHGLYRPKQGRPKISLDDPNLYLKSRPTDDISFNRLMKNYPILGEHTENIYRFFSLFIHPRFEKDESLENAFQELRKRHIDVIIKYLCNFLAKAKLFVFDDSTTGFNEDFLDNPALINNRHNIKEIDATFHYLANKLCKFKEGIESYNFRLFDQIRGLMIDYLIAQSLDYREQMVGKFKPFIEYFAVCSLLNSVDSSEEFRVRKLAFCYSSRLQVIEYLKKVVGFEEGYSREDIRLVFEDYYKDAYQVDFETFYQRLSSNSLYFISNDPKKSYNAIVNAGIERVLPPKYAGIARHLYKISKDMSHASGYNFDSSVGVAEHYGRITIVIACQILIEYLLSAEITLNKHGYSVDIRPAVNVFSELSNIEFEAIIQENTAIREEALKLKNDA